MSSNVFKFTGARPANYDQYLGPFLFEPFGKEMASRIPNTRIDAVLELAAGTGRVTRHLRDRLPSSVRLVANDLSPDMLAIARQKFTPDQLIEWSVDDMQNLSFADDSFDVVVCQYGLMFPSDKQRVFQEVYRVLKPGGVFWFSTWEKTDHVPLFKLIYNDHVIPFFQGEDASRFLVPYSLHQPDELRNFLTKSGFSRPNIEKVTLMGQGESAHQLVQGFFITHSVGQEVANRDQHAFESIARNIERDIIHQFGDKPVRCELVSYFGSAVKSI